MDGACNGWQAAQVLDAPSKKNRPSLVSALSSFGIFTALQPCAMADRLAWRHGGGSFSKIRACLDT